MHLTRFQWVVRILGVAGGLAFATASVADTPNILVIYTDDQGFGDASCLNPESKFETPQIDRLAREGIIFTDGHSSDTVCTPSRYGLLTGRYSWRTSLKRGVFGAERECLITPGRMTVASLLQSHGYRTAMVGKWHLGMDFPGTWGNRDWTQPTLDMPLDKGFDEFFGIPASMNYGVLAWFDGRFAQTPPTQFTRKKPNDMALSDYRIAPPYDRSPKGDRDLEVAPDFVDAECLSRFTDRAVAWIERHAADARRGKPFFLYVPYTSPHKPVIPNEPYRGRSAAGAYGDFLIETDAQVGRLLEVLEREQIAGDTLVLFTSDNGPENTWKKRRELYGHSSAGPYREGKRSIYEGGHRVPFVVRWPARIAAGRRCDAPVCQTDLLATIAEILGATLPDDAGEDSTSFLGECTGSATPATRPPIIHHAANGRFAIREGRWKLVMETGRAPRELYDLSSDPGETENVIADHTERAANLVRRITQIVQQGRTRPGPATGNDTPPWRDLTWIDR